MKPDEDEEGDVRRIQARRLLCMQYYARLAPRHVLFRWPPSAILIDIQNELLEDLQLKKSGEEPYRRSFLKELLKRLEDEVDKRRDEEVVSRIYFVIILSCVREAHYPCDATRK